MHGFTPRNISSQKRFLNGRWKSSDAEERRRAASPVGQLQPHFPQVFCTIAYPVNAPQSLHRHSAPTLFPTSSASRDSQTFNLMPVEKKSSHAAHHPSDQQEAPDTSNAGKQLKAMHALRASDVVFLSDYAKPWIARLSDITILDAEENYTRAYIATDSSASSVVIRRPLRECESRLDPSIFFRARRDCIVNLAHVQNVRFADPVRLVFSFSNRREVTLSRIQSAIFRKTRSL